MCERYSSVKSSAVRMGSRCNPSKKRSPRVSKLDNTTNSAQANKDKYLTRYSLLIPNQVREETRCLFTTSATQCEQCTGSLRLRKPIHRTIERVFVTETRLIDHVISSHLMDDLHHKKEYYNNSFAPVK